MAKSPMVETAIKILEDHGSELTFNELWDKVVAEMGIDKDVAINKIAKLYSDITLDKRVISLSDNKWDLRRRRKLDESVIDANDIIEEDLDIEDDEDYEDVEEDNGVNETIIYHDETLDDEFDEDLEEFKEIAISSED